MNARLTKALRRGRWAVMVALTMMVGSEGRALLGNQPVADVVWQRITDPARAAAVAARIAAGGATVVQFDKAAFDALTATAPSESAMRTLAPVVFSLPLPDGSIERFSIAESPMIAPELTAAFPEIRTFAGQGIDDPTATARFGWTAAGFHAIVLKASGTVYIDPIANGNLELYLVADKASRPQAEQPFICLLNGVGEEVGGRNAGDFPITHGTSLRTYRLAVAATGEYTVAAGGTKSQALARMVTTINRVTGIYERELAVRLTLLTGTSGDPTALIYTDGATDPYNNQSDGAMLDQNQTNLDNVIGTGAYDVGHVFGTGSGGVAQLRSPCGTSKARGLTALDNPTGDAFDVDFVSHEIGHQFGGNHTFNAGGSTSGSCTSPNGSRSTNNAYEVGSGSTIQAYAGICGGTGTAITTQNLQPNSNDYFTFESLNEMTAFITDATSGASCGTASATGNTVPTVTATAAFTIPASTPFTLTATGADANSDTITYDWEEYDLGTSASTNVATASDGSVTTRPLFRSYSPTTSPSRTFPSLTYILNSANVPPTTYSCSLGNCLTGEVLPSVSRTMNFTVTVRDNRSGGGAIITAPAAVTVVAAAGPFVVTAPNTAVSLTGGTALSVTWNVASTSSAPISAANVKISMSTDGGTTFGTVLAASTANDGAESVTVPNVTTSTARIKVEAIGNIFFDISNANFSITAANTVPDPPTGLVGTRGNGQVSVAFTPPSNTGGPAITGYTVTASPGGATGTGTSSPIVVSGLTNGTAYTFTATATNSVGTSAASSASGAVTPATVPGAPTSVSGTRGNAQVSVAFTAPSSNGGSAITGYTVTASPGGATGTGTSSPITVTGLTNGTAYTFTVTATNAVGTGTASSASAAVTPAAGTQFFATLTGAQQVPAVTSSGTGTGIVLLNTAETQIQVDLTFSGLSSAVNAAHIHGPAAAGANASVLFDFTSSTPAATSGTIPTQTFSITSAQVRDLKAGLFYFNIHTGNFGSGELRGQITIATVPGAPTGVTGTRGNGQVSVAFTAPSSNGGAAITGYTVTASPGGATATGTSSPITVTGLTNGTAYTFTVTATNSAGTGAASSASAAVTPSTVPGAPTGVTGTAGNAQVSVAFTAPTSNGGAAITGYTVTASPGGATGTGTASPIVVTGLTNGTAYTFTVTATNVAGTGAASSASAAVTPSAPSISASPTTLSFGATKNGAAGAIVSVTSPQTVAVTFGGGVSPSWTASANQPWVQITNGTGTGTGTFSVAIVDSANAIAGSTSLTSTITITASSASLTTTVALSLTVTQEGASLFPFGSFDTPAAGTTVEGSIPVSGWALDDVEVTRVEIWRDRVAGETTPVFTGLGPGNGKIYIADPVFVTGARNDVLGLYPTLPFANRAGWGYLLLTQGLYNQGNATFTLYAFAYDREGRSTVLGSKTITGNNIAAVKPFGSIDTPAYNQTLTDSAWNFGWALTPNASPTCTIPSTGVRVSIDSGPLLPVSYGDLRNDIAAAFPGFSNGAGSGGAYFINVSGLANGTHQIGWYVVDNCNRAEGIGSRFFNVLKTSGTVPEAGAPVSEAAAAQRTEVNLQAIEVRRGDTTTVVAPEASGDRVVPIAVLERVEVVLPPLDSGIYTGYQLVEGARGALPIGSSLDTEKSIFYWEPAAGYLGAYDLEFVPPVGGAIRVRVVVGSR